MEVLQDGVLAFLAATGLAALFWLLTGWFRRREPARVMLLIPARPGCDFAAPAAQMLDLRRARELTERYDDLLLLTAAEIPDHLP